MFSFPFLNLTCDERMVVQFKIIITPAAVVMYSYICPGKIKDNIRDRANAIPVKNKDLKAVPRVFFAAKVLGASPSSAKETMILVTEKRAPTIVEKAALMMIRLNKEPIYGTWNILNANTNGLFDSFIFVHDTIYKIKNIDKR